MNKLMGLLNRRSDMTLDQFSDHWRTVHRELALRLVPPGHMLGYVQNHRIDHVIEGLKLAADGVPEVWIRNAGALAELAASPEFLEGACLDEPNFMDMNNYQNLTLDMEILGAGVQSRQAVADQVKAMFFFNAPVRATDLENRVCSFLMPQSTPLRLSWHLTAVTAGQQQPYNCVETSWWPDIDSFDAAWSARDRRATSAEISDLCGILIREEPVMWPLE